LKAYYANGTIIAKVLCIWVEIKQRLLRRRREATGNFGRRFERADEWDNYMHFYEEAINKTSSSMHHMLFHDDDENGSLYCG
jgi:hypothetical protein